VEEAEVTKMLSKLRRNKDIKALGLRISKYGDCQVGSVIKIIQNDRQELFGYCESYEELLVKVLEEFKA
jgi:hypothetical protein